MPDLILHHYNMSPFAEKARLILGHKGLAWQSVHIPPVLPTFLSFRAMVGLGSLFVLLGILALSGYALYYWIPEAWRDALGLLHGGVGTLTVLGLWYHRRVSSSQGH